jgi:hypothetical protein
MTRSIFEPSRCGKPEYRSFQSLPLVAGICAINAVHGRALVPWLFDSFFNPANALAVMAFCFFRKKR